MSNGEIFIIRGVFPGEDLWIQGQLSGDFRGRGMLIPRANITFNRGIIFLFFWGELLHYFLD